ncbi:MAG: glycosyltransferase [Desulfobacterales bacterium]|nr:glycosyltransferase [Desulfobacterales bacterium]
MLETPLVSVVIPAYNHECFIADAIQSVLDQTYTDIELIIIDDASSDKTLEVIHSFQDNRLQVVSHEKNMGSAKTINHGIEQAKGEYVAILNSDDLFYKERIAHILREVQEHNAVFAASDIELIDRHSHVIRDKHHWWIDWYESLKHVYNMTQDIIHAILSGNMLISTSNFFFKKELIAEIGNFQNYRYVQDYEFILRMLSAYPRSVRWLNEKLLYYRIHETNTIGQNALESNRETIEVILKWIPELIETPKEKIWLKTIDSHLRKISGYMVRAAAEEGSKEIRDENKILRNENKLLRNDNKVLQNEIKKLAKDIESTHQHWQSDAARFKTELDTTHQHWRLDADRLTKEIEKTHTLWQENVARLRNEIHAKDLEILQIRDQWHKETEILHQSMTQLHHTFQSMQQALRQKPSYLKYKKKIKNLSEFQAVLPQLMDRVDVISFDIFDTLLIRRVEPPEMIHEAISKFVADHCNDEYQKAVTPETALGVRHQVEHELRQASAHQGLDLECRYSDLVYRWLKELIHPKTPLESSVKVITDFEMRLEMAALYPNTDVVTLLLWLKQFNKKMIAISDMYLDTIYITALLDYFQMKQYFDQVFVSSDLGICKYSGRLFGHVSTILNCAYERMIHIGDNPISDVQVPLRLGIHAFYLYDRKEKKRRRILRTYRELSHRRNYWKGKHLDAIAQSFSPGDPEKSFFFQYGNNVLGYIFCTFMLGVIQRIKEHQIDHVYFLARDGFLFQKVFELFKHEYPQMLLTWPKITYAYLTRRTTAAASVVHGLSHQEALAGLYNPKQQGLFSILQTYSLPIEPFIDLANKHGLNNIKEPLLNWHDSRLLNFLDDAEVQLQIKAQAMSKKQMLEAYLEQIGFFSQQKIALVDIGWNGSIQSYLSQTFTHPQDPKASVYPETYGLYFGFVNGIPHQFSPLDRLDGLVYDARRQTKNEQVCQEFEELFEESARSLEATVIGYTRDIDDDQVSPIFKSDDKPDRQAELSSNPLIMEIQSGMLSFAKRFIDAVQLTGYDFSELKSYTHTIIERAVAYPTQQEVNLLTRLSHSEDFGGDEIMDLREIRPKSRAFNGLFHIKKSLVTSNWRYGTLVSMKLRYLLPWFRLMDMRK